MNRRSYRLVVFEHQLDAAGGEEPSALRTHPRPGSVQYAVCALPMSREDWQRHFGTAWPGFRDAKRRYDPAGVLTPGYGVF